VKKGGIGSAEDAGVSAFFFGLFSVLFFLDTLFIVTVAAKTGKGNGSDQTGKHKEHKRLFHSRCFRYKSYHNFGA